METPVVEILLDLAVLFGLTLVIAGLLARIRIPEIIAGLLVAMVVRYTPLGERLLEHEPYLLLTTLAQLGVLFLLFYVGTNLDLVKLRRLGPDVIRVTFFNTALPFILGFLVMILLGYGWLLAFVIGLTLMPTAKAVVVPILDEFGLVRTRVGQFIIGVGTLDDVLEVFLITVVSVWIGVRIDGGENQVLTETLQIIGALILFGLVAWIGYRWLIARLVRWLPRRPQNIVLVAMLVMLTLGRFHRICQPGDGAGRRRGGLADATCTLLRRAGQRG